MSEQANKKFITEEEGTIERLDKVLIYGENSVGKSASAATALIDAPEDRRLIFLMTERNAAGGLEWGLKHYEIVPEEGQVIYVFPKEKKKAFANLNRAVKDFSTQSKADALKGDAKTTGGKENYTYLSNIINKLEDFTGIDYATGKEVKLGNVGNLDKDDILFIDGLSPISKEVWNATIGDKIAISMTDYMPAQNILYGILAELSKLDCHVVLYAHSRDKTDDDGKLLRTEVDTGVGVANYSRLMGLFTDVIYAKREGLKYGWAVNTPKVHASSRRIDNKEKDIQPDFSMYGFFSNEG